MGNVEVEAYIICLCVHLLSHNHIEFSKSQQHCVPTCAHAPSASMDTTGDRLPDERISSPPPRQLPLYVSMDTIPVSFVFFFSHSQLACSHPIRSQPSVHNMSACYPSAHTTHLRAFCASIIRCPR